MTTKKKPKRTSTGKSPGASAARGNRRGANVPAAARSGTPNEMQAQESLTYSAGPYKGYFGRAEYDSDACAFHGQVIGTRDVITFAGETIDEIRQAFRESVDEYLRFCQSRGEQPEKPFSGKFVVRVSPQLHRKVSAMAESRGESLNAFIVERLEQAVENR